MTLHKIDNVNDLSHAQTKKLPSTWAIRKHSAKAAKEKKKNQTEDRDCIQLL